jgi:hypothetical protein
MSDSSRRLRRLVTNIALLGGTAVLGVFTARAGLAWYGTRSELARLETEEVHLTQANGQLRQLFQDVQVKGLRICNQSEFPVQVLWVHADYPAGEHMASFDSAHCPDWKPLVVEGGKSEQLHLSSPQPECNWQGQVAFYSMVFVQPDVGQTRYMAGPFLGFPQDCFTIQ